MQSVKKIVIIAQVVANDWEELAIEGPLEDAL